MGDREAAAIRVMLSELMRAPKQSFPKPGSTKNAPKKAGVYVIHELTGRFFTSAKAVISANV